ncbi:MAG: hypothetical protein MZV70_02835 [Desulfobacterales bacterium]|nr:hypothetical protein [Desulfobacterales bacterium]
MIRSLLAIVLVLLACLFSISEELVFSLYRRGRDSPPITVRANRAISLDAGEKVEGLPAPRPRSRSGPARCWCRSARSWTRATCSSSARSWTRSAGRCCRSPLAFFVTVWSIVFLGAFLLALPRGYRHSASPSVLLTLLILQLLTIKGLMLLTALPIEILPIGCCCRCWWWR